MIPKPKELIDSLSTCWQKISWYLCFRTVVFVMFECIVKLWINANNNGSCRLLSEELANWRISGYQGEYCCTLQIEYWGQMWITPEIIKNYCRYIQNLNAPWWHPDFFNRPEKISRTFLLPDISFTDGPVDFGEFDHNKCPYEKCSHLIVTTRSKVWKAFWGICRWWIQFRRDWCAAY